MNQKLALPLFLRLIIPFALGYFLSHVIRAINAILSTELQNELSVDANQLGFLTSMFLLSFAALQIPLGIWLDRYGPRKVEGILMLFAALGCLVFAKAEGYLMLAAGRLLMGVGMSACLMAAFTSINHWFEKSQVPSMNALIMTAGGLGAIFAAEPVQWLSLQFGWRNVFIIIAISCIISSVLLLLVVPHKQSPAASESSADAIAGIRKIFSSKIFWQISAMTMCSQAAAGAIIGLWSGPWLRDVGQLDPENIANMLRWIAISMTVGFLTIGNFAGWLNKRGVDFGQLTFGFMLLFLISQPLLLLPYGWWSVVGWVLFGFLGSSGILAYPLLTRNFDNKLAGRVNASLNLLVFLCSFAAQWGIGAIVKQWPANNNGFYPASAYQAAFAIIIAIQAIAIYYYWHNRDT